MGKLLYLGLAFGLVFSAPALAADTAYSFFGYLSCTKGQIGCAQWPSGAHPWVRLSFGNNLTAAECLPYQQESVALTGAGFCNPPIH